jgi:dynein heavy chain
MEADFALYKMSLETLLADCCLYSGFLTYLGPHDQQFRQDNIQHWKEVLHRAGLKFNFQIDLMSGLGQDKFKALQWQVNQLPPEPHLIDNALILFESQKVPVLIDPHKQARTWLENQFPDAEFMDSGTEYLFAI